MLDIFSGLRLVVKRRNINIDNAIFRCHWFFTSTLLVSFSLIITARQYVGQPIECHSVNKIPDSLLNSYCWVQSTFTVPQACNRQLVGVEVPYPCIDNSRGREQKLYAYYQWVGIVLFVQGLLFHLPYYLWKLWENGLIKAITGGLRVAVLNEEERARKKEIVVEYINDHLGCHKRYALKYFLCEFICLINLLGQLWATNRFFDGQFLRYGIEVMQYSSSTLSGQLGLLAQPTVVGEHRQVSSGDGGGGGRHDDDDHGHDHVNHNQQPHQQHQQQSSSSGGGGSSSNSSESQQQAILKTLPLSKAPISSQLRMQQLKRDSQQVDPMGYIFPRMTKCTYYDFGSSGDVQKHDALCLLPLNIINEKIYIALWFWFLILALLTVLVIIYRICAMISENVRCKGLISRCKLSNEHDIRLICKHCDVGDWFLFYMVAENVDPLIMREIVASISGKVREHLDLKRELRLLQEQADQLEAAGRNKLQLLAEDEEELADRREQQLKRRRLQLEVVAQHLEDPIEPDRRLAGSMPNSRRSSLADQVPLVKKIRKRLYSKRLWSIDLGSAELRQQLFGQQQSPATGGAGSSHLFASAPPASEMPLLAAGPRPSAGQLTRMSSSEGSSTSGCCPSGESKSASFVLEMGPLCDSEPCLDRFGLARGRGNRWRGLQQPQSNNSSNSHRQQ